MPGSNDPGIHYGVIPVSSLAHWAPEEFEADMSHPACPHCGGNVTGYDDSLHDDFADANPYQDFACERCRRAYDGSECFPDEAQHPVLARAALGLTASATSGSRAAWPPTPSTPSRPARRFSRCHPRCPTRRRSDSS
jgi:hypothetical protein